MTVPVGPVVSATHLRNAVLDTLKGWLSYYLSEAERAHGIPPGTIRRPRTWQVLPDIDANVADQYPALFVTSPGLAGAPTMDGEGNVRASWAVGAHVIIRGQDFQSVADEVGIYTAAMRTLLIQQASLDGLASTATWSGESYDLLDPRAGRTLGGGTVDLEYVLADIAKVAVGPLGDPPADPLAPPTDAPTAVGGVVLEEPLPHPAYE